MKTRLMAQVIYGAGLRLMELLRLRVKDLDLEQEIVRVRGGKGETAPSFPVRVGLRALIQLLSG